MATSTSKSTGLPPRPALKPLNIGVKGQPISIKPDRTPTELVAEFFDGICYKHPKKIVKKVTKSKAVPVEEIIEDVTPVFIEPVVEEPKVVLIGYPTAEEQPEAVFELPEYSPRNKAPEPKFPSPAQQLKPRY